MNEIKVSLIEKAYFMKPSGAEIGKLSKELPHCSQLLELSDLKKFADNVGNKGYTFSPATFTCGIRKKEYFEQQQLIALDFDSKTDKTKVTFEEIKSRADRYELPVLFAYETLSSNYPMKFRVVFLNDTSITDQIVANAVLQAMAIIFPESDPMCYSDVSKMYFGGKNLLYFDKEIPTVNIESIFRNMSYYLKEKYKGNHYKEKIYKFSIKTGIAINKNGLLDISVSYDPAESYDTTEYPGASCVKENGKISPCPIIYTSNIIASGENFRKYKISLKKNECTGNSSVGRTASSRTTVNKKYKNHCKHRSKTLNKMSTACKLYRIFENGERDMEHQELFGIATNLLNIDGGCDKFQYLMNMNSEYYDSERIEKWKYNLTYIKSQEYNPQSCKGYCPYQTECNHGKNILTTVAAKRGTVEKSPDYDERFSTLKEVEEDTFNSIREAYEAKDCAIYIIKSQTAAGKSHSYLRLMKENPDCNFLIASPTNLLKDEIYNKAKKLGISVKKTPSLEQIKDEIPSEIWNRIQKFYKRGQYKKVHEYIQKEIEQQDISCLKKYMEKRATLKTYHKSIITTHRYLLSMDEQRLKEYDAIIIDEDIIFKSIIANQCEIPISKLKKLIKETTHPLLKQRIKQLLKLAEGNSCIEMDTFEWDEEDEDTILGKHPAMDIASFCMADKFYVRHSENEITLKEDSISFIKPAYFSPNAKYIIVSATVDKEICQNYFQNNNVVFYECKKARYRGTLLQYPQKSMSRTSIANDPGVVRRLRDYFNISENKIITFKSENIGNLHFGNTEGSNTLEGKDILVIGTPYHVDFLYKLIAFNLDIDFDEEEKMESCYVVHNGYRFKFTTFKNEELRKIHFWMIESELEQAVGRARLLRNSCEVHLFSNFILSQAEIVEDFDFNKK